MAVVEDGVFQDEARQRDAVQDQGPQLDHIIGHLGERVKAAEGDVAAFGCGKRGDCRSVFGAGVGEIAAIEAERLFHKGSGLFGRSDDCVDQQVIDGVEPGGVEIAEPANGDRRGLAGKGEQTIAGRVPCQIDEDVNLVALNLFGQFELTEAGGVAPASGRGTQALGKASLLPPQE